VLEETKLRLTQPSLVELGLGLSLAIIFQRNALFPGHFICTLRFYGRNIGVSTLLACEPA
jgi:hypothetical protein